MEKMFETAIRNKMRFPFKGMISVEDLWDLDVHSLDSIFKTLNENMKKSQEESLLATKSKDEETLAVKIEIIKYIVHVKLSEADAATQAKERATKKQRIMELISNKKDEELLGKSVEELQAMLEELK